jgi:hypothetical protein
MRYFMYGYMNYMNYGSCQASNPKGYGTDKVMLVNASAMCVDAALTEDTGIVCDGPGVKVTSTGRFAYECCGGDLCNKLNTESLQVQKRPLLLASLALRRGCNRECAREWWEGPMKRDGARL